MVTEWEIRNAAIYDTSKIETVLFLPSAKIKQAAIRNKSQSRKQKDKFSQKSPQIVRDLA